MPYIMYSGMVSILLRNILRLDSIIDLHGRQSSDTLRCLVQLPGGDLQIAGQVFSGHVRIIYMIENRIEEIGKEEAVHLVVVLAIADDMFLHTREVTVELLDDIGSQRTTVAFSISEEAIQIEGVCNDKDQCGNDNNKRNAHNV